MNADPRASGLFLGAFFDELMAWGVRDVVVSPGSRSTPLAMVAYEASRRFPDRLRLMVDVDERGAAFVALGMAKASGRPAALICTSGTAVGNYYPAVLEAESSRVPLIVLTGDRPPRLQGLGAPQTCDQLNAFGAHVRAFRQMPLPAADDAALAFARQAAREACLAAAPLAGFPSASEPRLAGACTGGPVHVNFPFEEPLKPNVDADDLFVAGRRPGAAGAAESALPHLIAAPAAPVAADAARLAALVASRRALVLAGEGTCATVAEAQDVLAWARAFDLPLLADPLSGLRSFDDPLVIDNYDTVLGGMADHLMPQVVIRFGRYPVSKRAAATFGTAEALHIVVDPLETRDFNDATDVFVRCEPAAFARALADARADAAAPSDRHAFSAAWIAANDEARARIASVDAAATGTFEGSFVRRVTELAPPDSCLFSANSMAVRALDTFYLKGTKRLTVLANRGLNGIDGTVSSAVGAACSFKQTTLVIGDLALLHDVNALALQRELLRAPGAGTASAPSLVVVLLNNNGGAIFDMLPQQSPDPYFERLFLTPQDVDFAAVAAAFSVPYRRAETPAAFDEAYCAFLGAPGISLIEVPVPLGGLKERYAPYW